MNKKLHTHTPGPWTIDSDSLVMGGQVVAHAADLSTDSSGYEEGIANLRLIAAAPELLALLDRLVGTWDNYEDMGPDPLDPIIEAARKLAAKARGEG